MVRSSRITSTAGYSACICCTYSRPTGYSFPSLRRSISAPILPRARHTHMDWIRILDSGFWIRIGLDSGRNSPQPAAICSDALSSALSLYSDSDSGFGFGLDWITDAFAIHLLSFAIICCHLLSGGGNLLFCPGFSGAHPTLGSRNTARPHLAEPDHVQACHGIHGSFITKMVLTNKWYMER